MYNTGQREPKPRSPHHFSSPTQKLPVPPKSCQFHPKVAVFNQNLPCSSKCCWCQPENAGFTKSCQFHTKVSVFLRKKFSASPTNCRCQPKIEGFTQYLSLSPEIYCLQPKVIGFTLKLTSSTKSWFHQKFPVLPKSCHSDPKVAVFNQKLPCRSQTNVTC